MDWLDLHSLNGLKAFAAVAECGSFTQAGARLKVTQAAVSQQVKALEDSLGLALVDRSGRGIVLTAEGARLARGLVQGFTTIQKSVEAVTGAEAVRPLQITMSPAFAAEWMLPRIPAFQQRHPEITLMLNPSIELLELKPGGIDLAIRFRDRRAPAGPGRPLLVFDTAVVGATALLRGDALRRPEALTALPWLEELGRDDVADWFARHGVTPTAPLNITRMPGNLIMQAVRRGAGITTTVRDYFADDIRAGTVAAAFPEPSFAAFYLARAPGRARPAVKTFIKWLQSNAAVIENDDDSIPISVCGDR